MSDDNSRRTFLKWLGAGAGAATVGGITAGCPEPGTAGPNDGGSGDAGGFDGGEGDVFGGPDGDGGSGTDVSDGGRDTDDGGSDDAGDTDGGGGTCDETGGDIEGPFHAEKAPERRKLAPDDEPGQRIVIEGTVYEPDCVTPVQGAVLDVWHANDEGNYYDPSESNNYRLRGQVMTDSDGSYEIRTIKPGRYDAAGGERPAHVHYIISSPQFGSHTTQMYFAGDPRLGDDPCGGCNSSDPTLIVDFTSEMRNGEEVLVGTFDIVLGN